MGFDAAKAQLRQPAYFILGEEKLKGLQVYDIIQDEQLNYIFSTNNGLYYFDYLSFNKINVEGAKSNTFFNLVKGSNHVIYCNNHNNQVIAIQQHTAKVFYELNQDYNIPDFSLIVDAENNLLIGAKSILVVSPNGQLMNKYDYFGYLGPPFKTDQNHIIYHTDHSSEIISFHHQTFQKLPLQLNKPDADSLTVLFFFRIQNEMYATDLNSKTLFKYNPTQNSIVLLQKNWYAERGNTIRIYETGNEVWIAGTRTGIYATSSPTLSQSLPLFYENYFISNVFKDAEGNYLLGTFDHGILVIPELDNPDVIFQANFDPATSLFTHHTDHLFIGTSKGKLYQYNLNKLTTINQNGTRPIEGIFGNASYLLFDDGKINLYNIKQRKTIELTKFSLKTASFIDNQSFYMGTNVGLVKVYLHNQDRVTVDFIHPLKFRIYHSLYDSLEQVLYVSSVNGLYAIDKMDAVTKIQYEGKDIFPKQIIHSKKGIYMLMDHNVILKLHQKKITNKILLKLNKTDEVISKIRAVENSILAKAGDGLYTFNWSGDLVQLPYKQSRSSANWIIDFISFHDKLWISHADGVQEIKIEQLKKTISTLPKVEIRKIETNFGPVKIQDGIDLKESQNELKFTISSSTLRHRETIRYFYTLQPYDKHWYEFSYPSHIIDYHNLTPGSYTLQLKCEVGGKSSETNTFSFNILVPFYKTKWFTGILIFLFSALLYFLYRKQIQMTRRKAEQLNELNTLKLTAIQSQMNPHFIFNALNSIQNLVLKGDSENAYTYISTFSDLIRKTLNYSQKRMIDFEDEIDLLEKYLKLEKLRFKDDFNFEFITNGISDISIPPMIIQPFIENAIIHGLMHQSGTKKLKVSFHMHDALTCIVIDNGIGRTASKEIKQRKGKNYSSFSGEAIASRLSVLSHVFKGEFGYTYEDLIQDGQVVGTQVIIHIPFTPKF